VFLAASQGPGAEGVRGPQQPIPQLVERQRCPEIESAARALGYSPLLARIVAGRLEKGQESQLADLLQGSAELLTPPDLLPDLEQAVALGVTAIQQGWPVVLLSDYDADGASAHAVLKLAFRDYFGVPSQHIHSFIGHRLRDGYGVSENVVERILATAPRPALLVTADQGSTDHDRIARLQAAGFRVIITDHHGVPEELPPAPCVNPVRRDSRFPDPYIAGVHVAWLYCCALRQGLIAAGVLPPSTPKLGGLLDLVALGTVADCVDLARSVNNRVIVRRGLALMNRSGHRVVWEALAACSGHLGPISAATVGFRFAPLINARGRLDSALESVELLLCTDRHRALALAATLQDDNEERKRIQSRMLERAEHLAREQSAAAALCILDPEGHPGVQGICAARLAERWGRPVAFFSPKEDSDFLTASLRSFGDFPIRDCLAQIAERFPEEVLHWGGHKGAGGITIHRMAFERFQAYFQTLAARFFGQEALGPRIWLDAPLPERIEADLLAELATLEPFGRQWEAPVFGVRAVVTALHPLGDGRHWRVQLTRKDLVLPEAVWFHASEDGAAPIDLGQSVLGACHLEANHFGGKTRVQLLIRHLAHC